MKRAVFLDRDGVLNDPIVKKGKPYAPLSIDTFSIKREAFEATRLLFNAGFLLVVVTNQPDVGRNALKKEVVEEMHALMKRSLPLHTIEVCYEEEDAAYKPSPLMLQRVAEREGIVLQKSYMIGDRWRDVNAGNAAGCFTIFLDYGYEEPLKEPPHEVCRSLLEASKFILQRNVHEKNRIVQDTNFCR